VCEKPGASESLLTPGSGNLPVQELIGILKRQAFQTPEEAEYNYSVLYAENQALGDIVSMASEYPMFADRRVVVVRNFDKHKKERSREKQKNQHLQFLEYIKNPLDSTILVLTAGKLDKAQWSKEPFLSLKPLAFEFSSLNDPAGFARQRAAKYGWSLSPKALQILVSFTGNSPREIDMELQKLALYARERASDKTLTDTDVLNTVGLSREYNVFELDKAMASHDLRMASGIAMMIMERDGLKDGSSSIQNYLTTYFFRLWKLKMPPVQRMSPQDMSRELGLYGPQAYFLKEYVSYANQFTVEQIEEALQELHQIDLSIKQISPDPDRKLLILKLMNKILS
jgi:DNA polymerase-3 subunit delta